MKRSIFILLACAILAAALYAATIRQSSSENDIASRADIDITENIDAGNQNDMQNKNEDILPAEDVVRKYFEAWNNKDLQALQGYIAPDGNISLPQIQKLEYVKLLKLKQVDIFEENITAFVVEFEIKFEDGAALSCKTANIDIIIF